VGQTYNVGGSNQRTNLEVVNTLCSLLDELRPGSPHRPHRELMRSVQDRPGHDRRYAIDARKIESELGWKAAESFETGLRRTVEWYLANPGWIEHVTSGAYRQQSSHSPGEPDGVAEPAVAGNSVEAGR
jgi:dTDP-glucose 4,6-dehydratase